MDSDIVELSDSRSALLVAPRAGGRLMRWSVDGQQVIYWPEQYDLSAPARIRGGNPLLFPFLGRHRVGGVDGTPNQWRDAAGNTWHLPQHGFARDLPFEYERSTDGLGITLTLSSSPQTLTGYPFAFTFRASYRLAQRDDKAVLEVELETHNAGDTPLPYYAGHHFYFALPQTLRAESQLTLPATLRCHQLPDGSISTPESESATHVPGDPAIQDQFHLLATHADHPVATLDTPSLGRHVSIELDRPGSVPWYAVTTWTESDQSDFYCVEPWLGLPNAIHHGQGLRWLAAGETEKARCSIVVRFDKQAGKA